MGDEAAGVPRKHSNSAALREGGQHMKQMNPTSNHTKPFRARTGFVLLLVGLLMVIIVPELIHDRRFAQYLVLASASVAIASGWLFLIKYPEPNSRWRAWIALLTSIYLTASIPVYLFELSPIKWFWNYHPVCSMYAMPWVRLGSIPIFLAVAFCVLGRGRARIAFLVGSFLLVILWAGTSPWLY